MTSVAADLRAALARLAMPASEQIEYLRNLGVEPSADELALELDDVLHGRGYAWLEEPEIQELVACLDDMSGPDHAELWTFEALESAEQWARVRRLASQTLAGITNE